MTSHPNRAGWRSDIPAPTPAEIRALRGDRTQAEMADIAGLTHAVRWTEYESGTRRPHWALWELCLLRADKHPALQLKRRVTSLS